MNYKKQIERLKKEVSDVWIVGWEGNPHNLREKLWDDELENIAIELHNIGYRKQSEGEWIPQMQELGYCDTLECSLCRFVIDVSQGDYKYCPNCGAKMKGGAE